MTPLRIYISAHCPTCAFTFSLVNSVRQLRPRYPIEVINLDKPDVARPAHVFGTPTYCLGRQVISLGNPSLTTLLATLDQDAASELLR